MRILKLILQILLVAYVILVLGERAATAVLSHDENKFIYAGQALADHGRLPYRDYPFDQMPYSAFFYAVSAKVSPFDFLAARVMGMLVWLGCFAVLLMILRLLGPQRRDDGSFDPGPGVWLAAGAALLIFLLHPLSEYVMSAAKNNSFATLGALLAFYFFARGVLGLMPRPQAAFWSALLVTVAGCFRLNYLGLLFVVAGLWILVALRTDRRSLLPLVGWCVAGALAGALPALVLAGLAPAQTYYANVVQLRLTTIYYQGILSKENMDLATKWASFAATNLRDPITPVLYGIQVLLTIVFTVRFLRSRSVPDLVGLGASAFAAALLATAFMATPMLEHYLFPPLPFLLILMVIAARMLFMQRRSTYAVFLVSMLALLGVSSTFDRTIGDAGQLLQPQSWPPLKLHDSALALARLLPADGGKVLSMLPMFPAEAGYDAYPFTASGSNSWRTSPLLAADRRSLYGVVSPDELPALLDADPPVAILTGLETPNPGFTFQDVGGLEKPFSEYAQKHGYQAQILDVGFYGRPLTLWVRGH